jgi:hypothetical protein
MSSYVSESLTEVDNIVSFQVYGDNLSECLKFCKIIADYGSELGLEFQGERGPDDIPVFMFEHEGEYVGLLPCGRYEDWSPERSPTIGQEASDIILCHTTNPDEVGKPILGIEFNDAISAGNQDWQRFPRIAQAAARGIPYVYTVSIASAEVTEGEIRSFRHPNAIIQIGQLALMAKYGSLSLTVYSDNPWYDRAIEDGTVSEATDAENWEQRVAEVAVSTILSSLSEELHSPRAEQVSENAQSAYRTAFSDAMSSMLLAMSEYVESDFTILQDHPILTDEPEEVAEAWLNATLEGGSVPDKYRFYEWIHNDFTQNPQPFKKSLSTESVFKDTVNPALKIKSTTRKDDIQEFAESWDISDVTTELKKSEMKETLYSSENAEKVPISYKRGANEIGVIGNKQRFTEIVREAYRPNDEVLERIKSGEGPILLLPIAGYVRDTGGPAFSRPDKGFVRLIHEVFGDSGQFGAKVAILYSELIPTDWMNQVRRAQREDGQKLSNTNNLWRELAMLCDVIITDICDSEKDCSTGMIV